MKKVKHKYLETGGRCGLYGATFTSFETFVTLCGFYFYILGQIHTDLYMFLTRFWNFDVFVDQIVYLAKFMHFKYSFMTVKHLMTFFINTIFPKIFKLDQKSYFSQ